MPSFSLHIYLGFFESAKLALHIIAFESQTISFPSIFSPSLTLHVSHPIFPYFHSFHLIPTFSHFISSRRILPHLIFISSHLISPPHISFYFITHFLSFHSISCSNVSLLFHPPTIITKSLQDASFLVLHIHLSISSYPDLFGKRFLYHAFFLSFF